MNYRSIVLFTIPLATLCLTGCPEPGDPDDITLEEVPQRLAQSTCDLYRNCYSEDWLLKDIGPVDDCENWFGPQLEDQFSWVFPAIDDGTLETDSNRIRACVHQFERNAASCSMQRNTSCLDFVVGTLEAGQPCERSEECSPGSYCHIAADCTGACTANQGAGDPCEADAQCGRQAECAAGECAALADLGGACGGQARTRCLPGYVCKGDDGADTSGTCSLAALSFVQSLGEPCGNGVDAFCEPQLSCVYDESGDNGTCQERATAGAACTRAEPDMCVVDERCVNNLCVKLAGPGDQCRRTADCGGRLFCGADDKCRPAGQTRLGDACESKRDCASQICTNGTCSNTPECRPTLPSDRP